MTKITNPLYSPHVSSAVDSLHKIARVMFTSDPTGIDVDTLPPTPTREIWNGDITTLLKDYYAKYSPNGFTDEVIGEKIVAEWDVLISKGKRKGEKHTSTTLAKLISDLRCKGRL